MSANDPKRTLGLISSDAGYVPFRHTPPCRKVLGFSHCTGRYAEAVTFGGKAVQQRDGITAGHRIYLASLAQAGRVEEARIELQHLRELQPDLSIAWCEQYLPYTPAPMAKFLEGLRKAGVQ